MAHHVITHTDLNGLQYLTILTDGIPDCPRMYRMKGLVAHRLATFEHEEHAHRYGRKRAAAIGVPYLHGYGRHLKRVLYDVEYFRSVNEAAQRYCITSDSVRAMANGRLNEVYIAERKEGIAIRWAYSKKSKAKASRVGRPLGSKNRPKERPDMTGWPSLTWDALPHPRGYKAWRAAVRAHGGFAEGMTAWFPTHDAAGAFALAVASA